MHLSNLQDRCLFEDKIGAYSRVFVFSTRILKRLWEFVHSYQHKLLHKVLSMTTYLPVLDSICAIGTPSLPKGVLSNRPCQCVCQCVRPFVRVSIFKYLRDRLLVFSSFLHEVRAPYEYKSDRAWFFKNRALSLSYPCSALTSCKKLEMLINGLWDI